MPVFHVKKTTDYTVMSNHHLRDKSMSLKAKGLLSQILSLPEEWDYTLQGLAYINREQIDAIRQAVHELERAGYIVRTRERDNRGRLRGAEYAVRGRAVGHQLFHGLPAVGRLVGPAFLLYLPASRPERIGQHPGRQLSRPHG